MKYTCTYKIIKILVTHQKDLMFNTQKSFYG